MRIAMGIAGSLLTMGAMTAYADSTTAYGLDIAITSGTRTMDFDGTFDFSKSGTCTASSLLCGAGTTPELSKIQVSDGFNGSEFTQGTFSKSGSGEHVTFYDLNGLPGLSSQVIQLSFDVNAPLGSASQYKLSDIVLNVNNNGNGMFACGGKISCSSSLKAVPAPEMDVASTGTAAGLLFGSLAVLGGRRLRVRNRQI